MSFAPKTFTKALESPLIPNTHMVLTETNDSADYILNANNIGLIELLKDPRTAKWFKSLVVSISFTESRSMLTFLSA